MKVILPLAGYATRLYPLTENTPKSLLKVGSRPMIEHILAKVESLHEVDEVYIVTNQKFYQHFIDWLNSYKPSRQISIKVLNDGTKSNDDRLGAVGDVNFVVEHESVVDDLLVIAGDNLFGFDLKDLVALARKNNSSSLAAFDFGNSSLLANKFGVVDIDSNFKVIGFEEKPAHPKTSLCATMIYFLKKDVLHLIKDCLKKYNPDHWGVFSSYLISKHSMYCLVFKDYWHDIGSLEQYKEVNDLINKGELVLK